MRQLDQELNKKINKHVAKKVRLKRVELDINSQDVAKYLKMANANYSRLESGEFLMKSCYIYKLSKLFKVPPNYFFEGFDEDVE